MPERGLTQELKVIFAAIELEEADVRLDGDTRARVTQIGVAARNDGKALAFGLPGKIRDRICVLRHILEIDIENARRTLKLDYFNRKVLLAHTENLKVAENRFFRFGMAVDTYAEKIALILPIQPTL